MFEFIKRIFGKKEVVKTEEPACCNKQVHSEPSVVVTTSTVSALFPSDTDIPKKEGTTLSQTKNVNPTDVFSQKKSKPVIARKPVLRASVSHRTRSNESDAFFDSDPITDAAVAASVVGLMSHNNDEPSFSGGGGSFGGGGSSSS